MPRVSEQSEQVPRYSTILSTSLVPPFKCRPQLPGACSLCSGYCQSLSIVVTSPSDTNVETYFLAVDCLLTVLHFGNHCPQITSKRARFHRCGVPFLIAEPYARTPCTISPCSTSNSGPRPQHSLTNSATGLVKSFNSLSSELCGSGLLKLRLSCCSRCHPSIAHSKIPAYLANQSVTLAPYLPCLAKCLSFAKELSDSQMCCWRSSNSGNSLLSIIKRVFSLTVSGSAYFLIHGQAHPLPICSTVVQRLPLASCYSAERPKQ